MKEVINKLNEILEYIKHTDTSRYMDISEVSEYCGVSKSTIRRNVKSQALKASNTTGKLLFKVSDVEGWLTK
jgi:excisionase family DNA binding protein